MAEQNTFERLQEWVKQSLSNLDTVVTKAWECHFRDRTSYLIQDLEPSASYLVDMQFSVPEGLSTRIESAQHVEMRTAPMPRDEYQFSIILNVKRTDAYSASLVLEGIPEPVSKFVHVINIMYKSDAASEHLQNFVVLKEPKMLLEDLKPGQRFVYIQPLYAPNSWRPHGIETWGLKTNQRG